MFMSIRLPLDTWENIFRNVNELQLEQEAEEGMAELIERGVVERIEVEVVWLDGTDEWCLCSGCELFEDGFETEREAQERLDYLEKKLL